MADFISQAMSLIAAHAWAGLGGLVCMVFVTLLTDRSKAFPTWNSPWRPFLGTLLGAVGLVLNQIQGGNETAGSIINVFATALPTLIAELLVLTKKNSGGPGGSPVVDVSKDAKSVPPNANGAAFLPWAFPLLACLLFAPGCAWLKGATNDVVTEIPAIVSDIQEAQTILDAIRAAIDVFFLADANPKAQADALRAFADCENALFAVNNATVGADDAAKGKLDEALSKFKLAYAELDHVLLDLGILKADGKLGIARAGTVDSFYVLRAPRLMLRKAGQ